MSVLCYLHFWEEKEAQVHTHSCICEYTGLLLHHSPCNSPINLCTGTGGHQCCPECLLPEEHRCTQRSLSAPWLRLRPLGKCLAFGSFQNSTLFASYQHLLSPWLVKAREDKSLFASASPRTQNLHFLMKIWWNKVVRSGRYAERWQSELSAGNHTGTNTEITDNNSTQMAGKQTKAQMLCQHFLRRMSILHCIQS